MPATSKRRCVTNHHFFSIISLFKSLLELFQKQEKSDMPLKENLEKNISNEKMEIEKDEALNDNYNKNNLFIKNSLQKRLTIEVSETLHIIYLIIIKI